MSKFLGMVSFVEVLTSNPPQRFHLVAVWRGSSRLGEIRDFMQVQFPLGLRILQVPLREWPDSTTPWLWAFDRYSLTITYTENCLESDRLCLVTLPISNECQTILSLSLSLLLCCFWGCTDLYFWSFYLMLRLEISMTNPDLRSLFICLHSIGN